MIVLLLTVIYANGAIMFIKGNVGDVIVEF
jgi:hypothetical protein